MTTQHQGSCLCQAVKFSLCGEFSSFFLCHCSRCQKDTGSAHAANLFAPEATLNWLQGETSVTTYQHANTRHSKSFCKHCGSALPTVAASIGCVVVPAGCLDSEVTIAPTAKIFVKSRASWAKDLNAVPSCDGLPGK
ncbi:GFA family protein [Rheinheimera aquimaris]|uniref:GFA family protein n=1 Tax=Rheinheimera aquimaris TaxID=412437 RepID=UPI001CFFE8CC|nr:GFA family protein [Rheinheimera aquimaris]MCB5213262.1 GFA family protein [Rheinheimera aquimaris]|tara:strand:- start:72 stop:482 length:411 start_codon:yes stop_codon:yes gene_type:complete